MKEFVIGSTFEEALSLVPEGAIKKIKIAGKLFGITRRNQEFFVFDAFCPHRGASLIQGNINQKGEIICPLHQYRFELKGGKVKAGYCPDLETYPSELSEIGLKIKLPI